MSKAVSALQGKSFDGAVDVVAQGLRGMITLRGDLADKALRKVCVSLTGTNFPDRGRVATDGDKGLAWMSPDEVLVMVPHAQVGEALDKIAKALNGKHHLAVDVSDARAVFALRGPFAREVIAKLAPVDLHADAFGPGDFRRSRLGQIAGAFWMQDDGTIMVICFRSVADYAFHLLVASVEGGAVGHFARD